MLQERGRQVFVVSGDRDVKIGAHRMKQASMATPLMVNIESSPLKRCDNLPRFEDGQLRPHVGLRNCNCH